MGTVSIIYDDGKGHDNKLKMITLMTEHEEVHLLFPFKPYKSRFILIIKLEPKLGTCQVTIKPLGK